MPPTVPFPAAGICVQSFAKMHAQALRMYIQVDPRYSTMIPALQAMYPATSPSVILPKFHVEHHKAPLSRLWHDACRNPFPIIRGGWESFGVQALAKDGIDKGAIQHFHDVAVMEIAWTSQTHKQFPVIDRLGHPPFFGMLNVGHYEILTSLLEQARLQQDDHFKGPCIRPSLRFIAANHPKKAISDASKELLEALSS